MISANGVEYKNLPEQVQYLTERAAEFAVGLNRVSASVESVAGDVAALQTSYTALAEDMRVAKININALFTNVGTAFREIANIKNGTTPLFENITDRHGNNRFDEWNIDIPSTNPFENYITYAKASLSGSHLMIVICGYNNSGESITFNGKFAAVALPRWVINKIYPLNNIQDNGNLVAVINVFITNTILPYDTTTSQLYTTWYWDQLSIGWKSLTVDNNKAFRIQLDLIIDAS